MINNTGFEDVVDEYSSVQGGWHGGRGGHGGGSKPGT